MCLPSLAGKVQMGIHFIQIIFVKLLMENARHSRAYAMAWDGGCPGIRSHLNVKIFQKKCLAMTNAASYDKSVSWLCVNTNSWQSNQAVRVCLSQRLISLRLDNFSKRLCIFIPWCEICEPRFTEWLSFHLCSCLCFFLDTSCPFHNNDLVPQSSAEKGLQYFSTEHFADVVGIPQYLQLS